MRGSEVKATNEATSPYYGSDVPSNRCSILYAQGAMDTNDFVQKLLTETTLDGLEWASDVERILAEQVVFLRAQIKQQRQETVLGAHELISELYCRLDDKQQQIVALGEEIGFLRQHVSFPKS